MSTNTQNNIHNNNAAQLNTLKTNKSSKAQSTIDFSSLFTEAMGNTTPKAQLNALESEMRQALSKQEEKKKTTESHPMAAEMAQSLVWSQKNWNAQTKPNIETNTLKPTNTNNASTPTQTNREQEQPPTQAQKNTTTETHSQQPTQPAKTAEQQSNNTVEAPSQTTSSPNTSVLTQATNSPTNHAESTSAAKNHSGIELSLQPQTDASLSAKPTNTVAQNNNIEPHPVQTQIPNPAINAALTSPNTSANTNINTSNDDSLTTTPALKAGDIKLTTPGQAPPNLTNNPLRTTAAQTQIKTPVTQPGFSKELGQTVQWALGKNMSTVDIRINPESFGPMNMRLVQKGNEVQLIIRTQDDNSANLMSQAITGLKESMAQNGLQLGPVQIQSNTNTAQNNPSGSQQQWAQHQNEQQGKQHQHPASNSLSDTSDPTPALEPAGANPPKQPGRVDYFA